MGGGRGPLAADAGAGFGWNMAGGVTRAVAGLVINTMLARMLGPEPFGQLALAAVVIGLGSLLVDGGLGVGLIQKPEVDELDIRQAFTTQMGMGLTLAGLLAVGAPWGAALLGQAGVTPVLRGLAGLLAIQAFGQTGTALLRRAGSFQRLQQLQIGSYLASYLGLGIPLALGGGGVWSLVAAQLGQAALYAAGVWLATRHSVRPSFGRRRRGVTRFGMTIAASNVVAWAVTALPALLIGRFQGVVMLGYYSRAFFLVNMPASVLAVSLQTTALTVYSRAQRHARLTARLCVGMTAFCLLATLPPFLTVAAMPRTMVEVLFGERWLAMAGLLTPLALAMPLECVAALSGPLLIARGRPGLEFRVQAVTALSTLAVVGGCAMWATTEMVAWAVFGAVYLLRVVLAVTAMLRETGIPFARWGRAAAAPVALGAACFAAVRVVEPYLMDAGAAAWLRLLVMGSVACAAVGLPVLLGRLPGAQIPRAWTLRRMAAHV
jgi:O-antigen/teichoic acid export membrane protein